MNGGVDRWEMTIFDGAPTVKDYDGRGSLAVTGLDGDGQAEIIVGEHDPFKPYRSRCKLFVYQKADAIGRMWKCFQLDDRFEHHDGGRPIRLASGATGILSHGWRDSRYVHLWEPR
jgi:hypothetical protein